MRLEVKIDGKMCMMASHYSNEVERELAVIENGMLVSVHTFRRGFVLKTGMKFRTNGHDYEVIRGEEVERCEACGRVK